jgi:hypothetical protein
LATSGCRRLGSAVVGPAVGGEAAGAPPQPRVDDGWSLWGGTGTGVVEKKGVT